VKNQLLKNPQLMKRVLPQLVTRVQMELLTQVEKRVPTQLVKRVLTQLLMEVVKRQELTQAVKGRPIQLLKEAAVKRKLPQVLEMMLLLPKEMKKHRAMVLMVKKKDPVVKRVPMQGLVLRKVWREPMLLQTVSYLQKKGILQLLELGKELKKVLGLEQRVGLIQNFQPRLRIKWKERPWLM